MTAIIYVFSGTGNTKKICSLYKKEFEAKGVATTVCSVTGDFNLPEPNGFDLVGFAYPIHAFNAPKIMLDFAKQLQIENKEYFILKSSGEPLKINNISSLKFNGILKKKGCKCFAEYHYVMPYNMIFRHTDEEATKMWNTAQGLAKVEANEVLNHTEHRLKRIPFGRFLAWVMRIEHGAMRVNGKYFKIDADKCIDCGACIKNCPVGNITKEDGKFKFGDKCLMCTRCSFNCPTDAFNIRLLNNWRINGRYNFAYDGEKQTRKHLWYCKKAYRRYFENAEKKIAEFAE